VFIKLAKARVNILNDFGSTRIKMPLTTRVKNSRLKSVNKNNNNNFIGVCVSVDPGPRRSWPRACFEFCDEQLSKDFEPRLKKSKDSESRLKKSKDSESRLKKSKDLNP
jgi:hypothetical protein